MSFKEKTLKIVEDAKDALSEQSHRAAAAAEQAKRAIAGDDLTPAETAGSMLNEAKNNLQADVDHTKRDLRNVADKTGRD